MGILTYTHEFVLQVVKGACVDVKVNDQPSI